MDAFYARMLKKENLKNKYKRERMLRWFNSIIFIRVYLRQSLLFRSHNIQLLLVNLRQIRYIIIVLSPSIRKVRLMKHRRRIPHLDSVLILQNNLDYFNSPALETGNHIFHHVVFVHHSFIGGVRQNCDISLSLTIFAFCPEISCSVLLFHLHLLSEADAHLFGKRLVATGAFNCHKPNVFLGDLDVLDMFGPCE